MPLPPPQAPGIALPWGAAFLWPRRVNADSNARFAPEVEWKVRGGAKLHMDFSARSRLRGGMDRDTLDLIAQLGARIAMIMEDASVVALSLPTVPQDQLFEAVAELERSIGKMAALVGAARALAGQA